MGPKPDPDEIKYLYLKVVGGEVTSAAVLAPKCGPIGLPPKKVGEDIQKATSKWRGVKIQIQIAVQNRQCTVTVLPAAAPLLIEALKKTGRDRKKTKNVTYNGDLKFEQIVTIAKTMREAKKSMSIDLAGSVKEILGTCISVGCTVDKKSAKDVTAEINSGERKC